MDKLWSDARAKVDERRARGDVREAMIDLKLDEYNTTGWKMSQHAFNTMFGELLEAGADSKLFTDKIHMHHFPVDLTKSSNCKYATDIDSCLHQTPRGPGQGTERT